MFDSIKEQKAATFAAAQYFGVEPTDIKEVRIWWRVCLIVGFHFSKFASKDRILKIMSDTKKHIEKAPRPVEQPEKQPTEDNMHIILNRKGLQTTLEQIKGMNCYFTKIEYRDNKAVITAFDELQHFEVYLNAGNGQGALIVKTAQLLKIVKNVQSSIVKLSDGPDNDIYINKMVSTVEKMSETIWEQYYPADSFTEKKYYRQTPTKDIINGLKQVAAHASNDWTRMALMNIGIDTETGEIMSTDGHRLAVKTMPTTQNNSGGVYQYPAGAMGNVAKALKKDAKQVKYSSIAVGFWFSTYWETETAKKAIHIKENSKGQFPKIRQLLPETQPETTVEFNAKKLKSALKLLIDQRTDKKKQAVLKMEINGNFTKLTLTDTPRTETIGTSTIEGKTIGQNIRLGLNIDYLYEAVAVAANQNETIFINIWNNEDPVTISGDYLCLIMPIKLRD